MWPQKSLLSGHSHLTQNKGPISPVRKGPSSLEPRLTLPPGDLQAGLSPPTGGRCSHPPGLRGLPSSGVLSSEAKGGTRALETSSLSGVHPCPGRSPGVANEHSGPRRHVPRGPGVSTEAVTIALLGAVWTTAGPGPHPAPHCEKVVWGGALESCLRGCGGNR